MAIALVQAYIFCTLITIYLNTLETTRDRIFIDLPHLIGITTWKLDFAKTIVLISKELWDIISQLINDIK